MGKARWADMPKKMKRRLKSVLLMLCAVATFAAPAFSGGYQALMPEEVTSQAAAIEDVDLLLVAASAFGEARKVMNATDNELKDIFVDNTAKIIGTKWQNMGLLIGTRDSLSGTSWGVLQGPTTLSASEVLTYNNDTLADAYNKYKAFGFAVQNMIGKASKSASTSVSVEDGLDSMSAAAIKLGSFGVEFLNAYNPGPVLLSLYDSSYLSQYSNNKLVQIVLSNDVLSNVVRFFGDPVLRLPRWTVSMFAMINVLMAVVGFALWLLFKTLAGNGSIGDGLVKFLSRITIGTVGIFLIANLMSTLLQWVTDTVYDVGSSSDTQYIENNLNIYDWYLTGFQLPSGVTLPIDASGNFMWTPQVVAEVNRYTYKRLVGMPTDEAIRERMETYTMNGNDGVASFVTPSMSGGEDGAEAWATDVYYAMLKNYAENKEDLLDGNDDPESPLYGKTHMSTFLCRYLWMSSLRMEQNGAGWNVMGNGLSMYYGLNPISAFNLVRSDFSGESISAIQTVYPSLPYVGFDINRSFTGEASTNMNSIIRFIACFTLVLAALKGFVTIITAGFGGLISGGVKTATGSAYGLGQAIGAVLALLGGIMGISLIMSMTLSLLDTVYGIAVDLVGDTEVVAGFLQPLVDAVKDVPVVGGLLADICTSVASAIMTLVLSLTFPKLGGIPITIFAQAMADIPGHIGEKAQMLEAQLASGRSGGGGFGRGGGQGRYGAMAGQMAGQAFSSATKQTGAIMGAGMAAAGSLMGASLSTLGGALNKKADGIEGKPANPGLGNWDDMTEDQQSKAAEAAAGCDGWEDMSQDERQQYLSDAGVFDDGASAAADTAAEAADAAADGTAEEAVQASDGGWEGYGSLDDGAAPIPDAGMDQSMNQGMDQGMDQPAHEAPEVPAEASVDAPAETDGQGRMPGADGQPQEPSGHAASAADGGQDVPGHGPAVRDADGKDSMNHQPDASGRPGQASGQQAQGADGPGQQAQGPQGQAPGQPAQGADVRSGGDAPRASGGDTLNVNEGSTTVNGNSVSDANVRQDATAEVTNVDRSESMSMENVAADSGQGLGAAQDGGSPDRGTYKDPSSANAPSQAGAADIPQPSAFPGTGQAPGKGGAPSGPGAPASASGGRSLDGAGGGRGSGSGSGSGAGQSGPSYTSVNSTQSSSSSTMESASQETKATANVSNTANMSGDRAGGQSARDRIFQHRTGQPAGKGTGPQSLSPEGKKGPDGKAAQKAGQSRRGVNGTYTSRYGKQMSVKDQKKARALHAAGDALQMMGGNRSMGQGVADALGYAKDAAKVYATPEEFQSSDFMQSLRMKRLERGQRRQNGRRQDGRRQDGRRRK